MRWILAVLFVSVILLGACASPSATPTPIPTPTPSPAPTPQEPLSLIKQPIIPSNYATYTNNTNGFSISYPPDWVFDPSLVTEQLKKAAELEELRKKVYEDLGISEDTPGVGIPIGLFLAGVPMGKATPPYSPSVAVSMRVGEELVGDDIVGQRVKTMFGTYTLLLLVRTTVHGRQAVIREFENYDSLGMPTKRQLGMNMRAGDAEWSVLCTSNPEEFTQYEEDFYHIVTSLRLLK